VEFADFLPCKVSLTDLSYQAMRRRVAYPGRTGKGVPWSITTWCQALANPLPLASGRRSPGSFLLT
jgi:hypothetical protein